MEQTFTAHEVAGLVGLPYRTLMRLVERGDIRIDGYSGRRRVPTVWREKHVREASVWAQLRRTRLSAQQLRETMNYLRTLGHNPLSSGQFLVVHPSAPTGRRPLPRRLVKLCDGGEAIELLRRNRGQLVLPLWPFGSEGRSQGSKQR